MRGDGDGRGDRRTVEAHHPVPSQGPAAAFNELRRLVPGITQRMLTLQLRALEQDGVVARTVHNNVPPHVEYSFTRKGLTLGPILDAMEAWGEANRQGRRRA